MKMNKGKIWITGASSGIGEAIAMQLAMEGNALILSGRREAALQEVARRCIEIGAQSAEILAFDLANKQDYKPLVKDLWNSKGPIASIYHCGGVSQRSLVSEGDASLDEHIMQVNYFSAAGISKAILPLMKSNGGGQFIVISSLTGKFGFPYRSAYAASKHALHGFFESLYLEEWQHNIELTIACPGRVKTNISKNALTAGGGQHGQMDQGQEKGISAEVCASRIISASKKRKREVIIGKADVLMVYFKRYLPALFYAIAKRIDPK